MEALNNAIAECGVEEFAGHKLCPRIRCESIRHTFAVGIRIAWLCPTRSHANGASTTVPVGASASRR